MLVSRRLFPYPVLTCQNDDYVNSNFIMTVNVTNGVREICFDFHITLDNKELVQMIEQNVAEYVLHIENPSTSYRTVVKTDETSIKINIPECNLKGKVEICIFIVAKKDIPYFINTNFNEDYENSTFHIRKGNILAISNQEIINIEKQDEELSKITSIFTICRNPKDLNYVSFDLNTDKIVIKLDSSTFNNYKKMTNLPWMIPVLNSMIIIPALIYTFEQLKGATDDYDDYRWYKSIVRSLDKQGIKLDKELLEKTPSYELAQKSMNDPLAQALNSLVSFNTYDEE